MSHQVFVDKMLFVLCTPMVFLAESSFVIARSKGHPSDGPFFVMFWSRKHIQLGNFASMPFGHLRSGPSTVSCVPLRGTCLRRTPPHYSSPWLDGFLAVYVSRFSRNDDLIYGIALRVYCRLAEGPASLSRNPKNTFEHKPCSTAFY